ncbi:Cdc73 protein [Maudiozyma humilis]|uniref:Cdc73 protein n=1 Tax=Maudiozyma humilis TaxID=51915 RepID=A0AAV5RZM9_MAUHU|nr:Cdc73 protein [Kazachstania humilis]
MSSPLSTVREHLKNGDKFTLFDENKVSTDDIVAAKTVSFSDSADNGLSLDESTEFTIEEKPVVLRVILHCWLHKDSSAAEYLADCQKLHLTNISFLQRNDLINWLTGESETSQYIGASEKTDASSQPSQKGDVSGKNDQSAPRSTTTSSGEATNIETEDPVLFKTLQNERVLLDHNSSLRGSKPIDFGYLIKDAELKLVHSLKSSSRSKSGKVSKGPVSRGTSSSSVLRKDPIILIPSATSSMITLGNIKEFLEHSKYINPRDVTVTKEDDLVTIEKKFDNISRPLRFLVVNNTRMFTKPEYWDRVVAVFTTGHTWQFANYQWNTPQDLFQHCNGYYFHFNGEDVPQHVQQWNVQRIALDKHQRFKDVEVVRFFWTNLEKSLIARGYH